MRTTSRTVSPALLALAAFVGCGGGGGSSPSTPASPVTEIPVISPRPVYSPSPIEIFSEKPVHIPSPLPSPSPSPNSGGGVTIEIPPPQPVLCTPSSVSIGVAQRDVISCTSAGFTGPIAFTVADPEIATVALAAGTYTLFYVSGMQVGMTTVSFLSASGGTGQITITVVP